jgi:5-methylthioribose kinase
MTASGEPWLLDASNRLEVERYLVARDLVSAVGLPIEIARAGAGNMNLTLRVTDVAGRSFIVKQGRPWVEKYPHIPAPFERTLVEAAFYSAVQGEPHVANRMPAVLHVDTDNHVLVLEDIGAGGDFTSIYADATMPVATLAELLEWLDLLARVSVPADGRATFANRAMRALNHEHMFSFPLLDTNGLDLNGITPGLSDAARELAGDRLYCDAVAALGRRYLADGGTLVHGDYFPGSWLKAADGVGCAIGQSRAHCPQRAERAAYRGGRQVDDAPVPPALHVGHDGAAAQEHSFEIRSDDTIPQLLARLLDVRHADEAAAPRVIDQDVNVTEGVERRTHHRLHLRRPGHVHADGQARSVLREQVTRRRLNLVCLDIGKEHAGARLDQGFRRREPETLSRSRHDRHPSREPAAHHPHVLQGKPALPASAALRAPQRRPDSLPRTTSRSMLPSTVRSSPQGCAPNSIWRRPPTWPR